MRRSAGVALAILVLLTTAGVMEAQNRQERQGFWIGFGLGIGTFDCDDCQDAEGGFSGHFKLGGTVSQKLLFGFEGNGWVKEEDNATLSMSNASAALTFYPSATGGFHLKSGLGVSVLSLEVDLGGGTSLTTDDTGIGILVGLGYDARLGRNFSLTPFLNFVGGAFEDGRANFFQLGAGLTWH